MLQYATASMVEHAAVNRGVVGSSPVWGGGKPVNIYVCGFFFIWLKSLPLRKEIIYTAAKRNMSCVYKTNSIIIIIII